MSPASSSPAWPAGAALLPAPSDMASLATALLRHQRFEPAVAAYCEALIAPDGRDEPSRKLLHQLERYLTGFVLVRNYFAWRDGADPPPTLSRLQGQSGLSPRHTANLVATLRAGRLLADEIVPGDSRAKALRPMPAVIYSVGRSPLLFAEAADRIDGQSPGRAERLRSDTDALGRLVRASADYVARHGSILLQFPLVQRATGHDCGYEILTTIMAAHYRRQRGEPDISLSYGALAEQYGISESHAGNVMGMHRRDGLVSSTPRGLLDHVQPALVSEYEAWCACHIAHSMLLLEPGYRLD